MLILSRRIRESIIIGDHIELTVLKIDGSHVELGIKAPTTIPVHRLEVYKGLKGNNMTAAKSKWADLPKLFLTPTKTPPNPDTKHA